MNNPKIFYRELDALLAKIGKNISGKNFLSSIIIELEQSFGNELHIYDGSIYEKRDTEFVKIYSNGSNHWVNSLSADLPAIKEVLRHGSFIYDDPQLGAVYGVTESHEYIIPVAIFVHSPEQNWILAFSLKSGWMREEITLFLNAVRTALNYRLFSEIIGGELQQAVEIQKSLLPKTTPNFPGFQMYGKSIPAEQVGGDFYEYFDFEEGNFGISIGDVSGHGLPSALLVRDVVIGLRMGLAGEYKIVHTLKKLNTVIQKSTYSSNFVSLFIGELEKNGHLFYVNAGHPAPFLVCGDKISDLSATGIVLGFLKDIELQRSHIYLEKGCVLVLYTDGIIERQDNEENLFGLFRLKKLVKEHQNKAPQEIADIIFKTVFEFGHLKNWEDDITLVVIKRN